MSSRFRSLRRLRHSPLFLVALALFLASGGVVGGTYASFTAETQNSASTYPLGWLSAPSNLTFTPSGYDAQLSWTAGTHGLDGQSLLSLDNGSSSSCPTTGYASTAMASKTTGSYTQANANGFTTLSAAITSTTSTSLTVASSTGFPAAPFTIQIDAEQMTVTNVSGTTWTVSRHANSTTAATHVSGSGVVNLTDPYDGHYECYQMLSTLSGSSWNATNGTALAAQQVGLVPTGFTFTNATANKISTGDTFAVTFNQPPAALVALANVRICIVYLGGTAPTTAYIFFEYQTCAAASNLTNTNYQLAISGLTHGTTGSVTATAANIALTAATISGNTVTWKANGNSTNNVVNTTGATATAVVNGSTIYSSAATDRAPACSSATYHCQPTATPTH